MNPDLEPWIDRVYRFALSLSRDRHAAEDITQECLLRAIRNREQLHDPKRIKAWLFRIVANVWNDRLRQRSRNREQTIASTEDIAAKLRPIDDSLMQQEFQNQIFKTMQQLPDRQRTVLFLISIEELSQAEVASLLEISLGSVKANLSLARKTMRQILKPNPVHKNQP